MESTFLFNMVCKIQGSVDRIPNDRPTSEVYKRARLVQDTVQTLLETAEPISTGPAEFHPAVRSWIAPALITSAARNFRRA